MEDDFDEDQYDEQLGPGNRRNSRSDDAKRANHNALERKRRVFQKDKLQELREHVPIVTSNKASMVEILQKATVYIHHLQKVSTQQEREMAGLKQLSNQLMDRVTRASNGARIMWPPEANAEPLVGLPHMAHYDSRGPPPYIYPPHPGPSPHHAGSMGYTQPQAVPPRAAPPQHQGYASSGSAPRSSFPSSYSGPRHSYPSPAAPGIVGSTPPQGPHGHSPYAAPYPYCHGHAARDANSPSPYPTDHWGSSPHVHYLSSSVGASAHTHRHLQSPSHPPQWRPGASPVAPNGSLSSSYGGAQAGAPVVNGRTLGVPLAGPTPSPDEQSEGCYSRSMPDPGARYPHERKRSVRMEDDAPHLRSRKISKSETSEDMQLAADANLFHNFCERVRINSLSSPGGVEETSVAAESPAGGVFDMDIEERASAQGRRIPGGRPGQNGRGSASQNSGQGDSDDESDADEATSPAGKEAMCFCGRPWDGKMMIMCEKCQRWLHGTCAGIQGRHRPSMYVCERCR